MGNFQLKAIGYTEFTDCISLKTETSLEGGIDPRTLEESAG